MPSLCAFYKWRDMIFLFIEGMVTDK